MATTDVMEKTCSKTTHEIYILNGQIFQYIGSDFINQNRKINNLLGMNETKQNKKSTQQYMYQTVSITA